MEAMGATASTCPALGVPGFRWIFGECVCGRVLSLECLGFSLYPSLALGLIQLSNLLPRPPKGEPLVGPPPDKPPM